MQQENVEKVLAIVNENIKDANLTFENLNDKLIEFGMDSIMFIQIIVALEEVFGCEIPDSKLLFSEMETVNKIIDVLQDLYAESEESYR